MGSTSYLWKVLVCERRQNCGYWARSEVHMVVSISNITDFWEVMPSSLLDKYIHTRCLPAKLYIASHPRRLSSCAGMLWNGNKTSYCLLRAWNTSKFSFQLLSMYKQLFFFSVFCFTFQLLVIIDRCLWFSLLLIWNLKTVCLIFILLSINQHLIGSEHILWV